MNKMNLDKFEAWMHDYVLKNQTIRHLLYNTYQRVLYAVSKKIKSEGLIEKMTPDDEYEYLFGYYDKCPWDDSNRYILALRVKSATIAADSSEPADIVLIDLYSDKKIVKIATTHSWNVQQGCMVQWMSKDKILFNDCRNGHYCSVIKNIITKEEKIIDRPVYTISEDKKIALSLDFSRLHRLRPGYGYSNIEEYTKNDNCPNSTCIWKIDLETGKIISILKYTDLVCFETRSEMKGAVHKVNHLMISPNGKRFMMLHRWIKNEKKYTRLVTANIDGSDLYNLSDDDFVSHCCWKNNKEILSYLNKKDGGKGYYLLKDKTSDYMHMWPSLIMDGHPNYSYDRKFVATDTYPNRKRIQSIYVMDGNRIINIARVFSPFKYVGDVRCDLHPRWSKDGKQLCFDGSFDGKRGIYVVDTNKLYFDSKESIKKTNNKTLKISVIIPCYNCEDFIDETLKSLMKQTYSSFEVVCVNDGSKDNTLQHLIQWQKSGRLNIKIVNQKNGGVSNARNNGIIAASGEYLLFLDSDDMYHEKFIEYMVNNKEKYKADITYCRLSRNSKEALNYLPINSRIILQSQNEAMWNLLYKMGNISFLNFIYKKSIIIEKDIFFDENTKFGEDREFIWKYLCHCKRVVYIDIPLIWYRVNNKSATKSKASWRKTDLLKAVKRVESYLIDEKCSFSNEFNSYMYARAMWAVAKAFAVSRNRELLLRLNKEYPVRECMYQTTKDNNKLVAIASSCYLINPMFFYIIVGLKKH